MRRCERLVDDPNANGKCVQTVQFCEHTRREFKNSRHNTGRAYWKFTEAKIKSERLKQKLKRIAAHHASLKNSLKECESGKSTKYFSKSRSRNSVLLFRCESVSRWLIVSDLLSHFRALWVCWKPSIYNFFCRYWGQIAIII